MENRTQEWWLLSEAVWSRARPYTAKTERVAWQRHKKMATLWKHPATSFKYIFHKPIAWRDTAPKEELVSYCPQQHSTHSIFQTPSATVNDCAALAGKHPNSLSIVYGYLGGRSLEILQAERSCWKYADCFFKQVPWRIITKLLHL